MMTVAHKVADAVLKKIQRSPFYYKRYNNVLQYYINRTYIRYARECSKRYAATHPANFPPSPLLTEPAVCFRGAIDPQKARAFSEKMTELIDRNDRSIFRDPSIEGMQVVVERPLETLGMGLLDVLRNPGVDAGLKTFFRGEYAVVMAVALRSLPSQKLVSSWLWHSDCYPPHTCKLFLHLTPADAETGATEFMSLADTMAYRGAGYFGFGNERIANIEDFAREKGLPYRPFHNNVEAGDATIFNMNFFHRAVSPRKGFRDVLELFLIPSPIPWEEHLKQHADYVRNPPSGYPKDPNNLQAAAVRSTMM